MVQIPFTEYPATTKEITLDEESYKFTFVWNTRGEFWTLSILSVNDTPILSGVKLVLNYELVNVYRHLKIPQGLLYVYDPTNNQSKIQFSDFDTNGRNLKLVYIEEFELESI